MPFQSEAQRRYLYKNEPDVARKFQKETPKNKRLPERKEAYKRYMEGK